MPTDGWLDLKSAPSGHIDSLNEAIHVAVNGDTGHQVAGVVVVVAIDRLGRSLSGVIRTIETLTEAGPCARWRPAVPGDGRRRPPRR